MSCRQYRDHHSDPDWFFREYVAALTNRELAALISWNHERRSHPETRDDAERRLIIIDTELKRRTPQRTKKAGRTRPDEEKWWLSEWKGDRIPGGRTALRDTGLDD